MANENPPPKKAASNLFIGFDISTQQVSNSSVVHLYNPISLLRSYHSLSFNVQLKLIAIDDNLELHTEVAIEYDSDLKEFK